MPTVSITSYICDCRDVTDWCLCCVIICQVDVTCAMSPDKEVDKGCLKHGRKGNSAIEWDQTILFSLSLDREILYKHYPNEGIEFVAI